MLKNRLFRLALSLALVVAFTACSDGNPSSSISSPLVAGPYPVGVTRIELFDPDQGRTLLTEVWYPADESARGMEPAPVESYLPEGLESVGDNATIKLVAVRDVALSPDGPFPLIAFSHGSGGIRYQNSFQCEHLASHGYIVAAPDHQGNTFFDGSGSREELVRARPLDILFVLDSFTSFTDDPGNRFEGWVDTSLGFGVTGHSFGAFTSLAAASMDDRIVAVLPMAFGGPVSDTYDAATLLMLATEDKTIGLAGNNGIFGAFDAVPSPRFLAEMVDSGHYSFSFACQIGLPGPWDGDGCGEGVRFEDGSNFTYVDEQRVWDVINGYSAALFGRYIKGITQYEEFLATNLDPEITNYTAEF